MTKENKTLKEKMDDLNADHKKAKSVAVKEIGNALKKAMDQFKEDTGGIIITGVSIDFQRHYRAGSCDVSIITDIKLETNAEIE